MIPQLVDHLLAFFLVVIFPIEAVWTFRRLIAALNRGDPEAKIRAYRNTCIIQWVLVVGLIAWWTIGAKRTLPALGFTIPGNWPAFIGVLSVGLFGALIWMQSRSIAALKPERLERLRERVGDIGKLLPNTPRELSWFHATAITAGICEEILCRGFMQSYIASYVGAWPAVILAAVPFGLAHAYQGSKGILKTASIGLLIGIIYQVTGSLLWPMLIHAAIDLSAGFIGKRLGEIRPATLQAVPAM